jgi:hypothetical protein
MSATTTLRDASKKVSYKRNLDRDPEHEDLPEQDIEGWWDGEYPITTPSKEDGDYWLPRAVNLIIPY